MRHTNQMSCVLNAQGYNVTDDSHHLLYDDETSNALPVRAYRNNALKQADIAGVHVENSFSFDNWSDN